MCHLLIVDDHVDTRDALAELADQAGHAHHEAGNGAEALEWLEGASEPPCLILLDLRMPVMDGWDFLRTLRALPHLADVGVIVVSATIQRNAPVPVLPAKAFWSKPPDADQIAVVHRYCDKHRNSWRPLSGNSN